MARKKRQPVLDAPLGRGTRRAPQPSRDRFGRFSEAFARAMGTSGFLIGMTVFVAVWLIWNTTADRQWQFDPAETNFTLLTLILLAQNRQDDRDRVQIEQDRQRAERNLADTEYLAREVVALRMALTDVSSQVVTRDVLRQELKSLLAQLDDARETPDPAAGTREP